MRALQKTAATVLLLAFAAALCQIEAHPPVLSLEAQKGAVSHA
jgi:hypothetical protein